MLFSSRSPHPPAPAESSGCPPAKLPTPLRSRRSTTSRSPACMHAEPVSQWKGFSPGITGMRAVYAASLAKRGFTGPSGLFEGPNGLVRMFDQPLEVDWEDPRLEVVHQTVMKKYCSLIHGQPVLEATLALKRKHGLTSDDVD